MALKNYNPTSPARRGLVLVDKSSLYKGKPYSRSDSKKAIVTLVEGQEPIDVTSGI